MPEHKKWNGNLSLQVLFFVSDEIVWFFSAISVSVYTIIGSIVCLWNFLLLSVAIFLIPESDVLFPLTFISLIPFCPLVVLCHKLF